MPRAADFESPARLAAAVHRGGATERWSMHGDALPFDQSPGSPWLVIPPPVRAAFDNLLELGTPLAASLFGAPLMGVKCGCNAAFIVELDGASVPAPDADVRIRSGKGIHPAREGLIERSMLRPLVRGETLERWRSSADEWIVWPHERSARAEDRPLPVLPPRAAAWLSVWRRRLEERSDARGRSPWWQLFRIESSDTTQARVAWSDIGRRPRAAALPVGDPTVPLNSCYVARAPSVADAHALAALLNSPLAAAWLNVLAEPAHGGYRRYLGWTVSLMPLPADWQRARALLAPVAERAANGVHITDADLQQIVLGAYAIAAEGVEPLLAWAAG